MAAHTRSGSRAGWCCKVGRRVRTVKSAGALLVLAWSFLVWTAEYLLLGVLQRLQIPVLSSATIGVGLLYSVGVVLCPIGGWLADVYFGRYRVMRVSLQMMWFASVVGTVAMIIQYTFPETTTALNYGIMLPAGVLFFSGFSGYLANAVPFATDQMLEASAEELSAFIHWFIWTWYAGQLVAFFLNLNYDCSTLSTSAEELVVTVIIAALMSLTVVLDYLFRGALTIEPESLNPLKTVIRVLKYAATHKYPERRSALTYWEDDIPSRIDLGKSKYGGPFTTEQVEDVKTFLRILAVIASISFFVAAGTATTTPSILQYSHFREFRELPLCQSQLAGPGYFFLFVVVPSVPLYEFLIYPLARNWIPSMLKKVGIGAILIIALNLLLFTTDTVGHAKDKSIPCIFAANESSPAINMNYLWVQVPIATVDGLLVILYQITLFEFTCAQTPYSMKGLLTGIAWSVFATFFIFGSLVIVVWNFGWKTSVTFPSCGFWYYLFTTVAAIVGFVVFILIAKWYSKRERDERPYDHAIVEDVYDRYCQQSARRFVASASREETT